MKLILIPLFSVLCLAAGADAQVPQKQALTAAQNEQLYQAGYAERNRITKEADQYLNAETERAAVSNDFKIKNPKDMENPKLYMELSEKNDGFIGNVDYWQTHMKAIHTNLLGALGVNDLATARILIKYMRDDHWAIINEVAAIKENNLKAKEWPYKVYNITTDHPADEQSGDQPSNDSEPDLSDLPPATDI